jgi:hypothetical protein
MARCWSECLLSAQVFHLAAAAKITPRNSDSTFGRYGFMRPLILLVVLTLRKPEQCKLLGPRPSVYLIIFRRMVGAPERSSLGGNFTSLSKHSLTIQTASKRRCGAGRCEGKKRKRVVYRVSNVNAEQISTHARNSVTEVQ